MKVLILANSDAGLYHFRKELIIELLKKNLVSISVPNTAFVNPLRKMGCKFIDTPIERRGINPFTDVRLFCCYMRMIKKENPSFVITYTIKPNIYGGMACRILHVPYVVNITGLGTAFENEGILRKIVTIMNKIACRSAKIVFFENEQNRCFFVQEGIVGDKQTHKLNGAGVNLERYAVTDYPIGEKIIFLFIGRVMSEKGINELFIAMERLIADDIKCELHILGEYEEDYKVKIDKYEKKGWLHYYGYQEDVRPFIESAHCLVLPSWHEGMANANLESAACGRPVITSNIPGCKEAVKDNVSGYLVEKKNAEDLYKAMKIFTKLSYAERKNMGLAGRKHMENFFDKKKVVAETIKCMDVYL